MMFQTGSSSAVLSAAILFLLGGQLNVVNSFYIPGLNPQNFKEGDDVPLKVNKLSSPETLLPVDYYRLPFCQPTGGPKRSHENLGELLMGDRIETSPYTLQMKTDMYCNQVCVSNLGRAETEGASLNKVARAIRNNYHANWLVDNLPSGSKFEDDANEYTKFSQGFPIGFVATDTHLAYVNNHVNLQIFYHPVELEENKYRVVEFLVEPMSIKHDIGLANDDDNLKEGDNDAKATYEINNPIPSCNPKTNNIHTTFEMITAKGREAQPASGRVLFTYDVIWTQSSIKWASRWDNYLKMEYGSKIHWLSILNSLTIVLILSAVLAAVLVKNLRRDYQRYNRLPTDEERLDDVEEFGWKLVHADVFRPPSRPMLMSIILGTGTQLLSMTLITIFFAALGFLSPANRGGLLTALLVTYVLLGSVSGYVCARMYKTFKGKSWQQATTFNAFAFPTLTFGLFFIMDVVAMAYGSSDAVPFTTILLLLVLWLGISTPLVYFGAYFGFKQDAIEFPVNTSNIPRQIPDQPWFSNSFFRIHSWRNDSIRIGFLGVVLYSFIGMDGESILCLWRIVDCLLVALIALC